MPGTVSERLFVAQHASSSLGRAAAQAGRACDESGVGSEPGGVAPPAVRLPSDPVAEG